MKKFDITKPFVRKPKSPLPPPPPSPLEQNKKKVATSRVVEPEAPATLDKPAKTKTAVPVVPPPVESGKPTGKDGVADGGLE